MPNKSSKAGHVPQRTCVICKQRYGQKDLLGFYFLGSDLVYDIAKAVQTRKRYVCNAEQCLIQMDKWQAGYLKKAGALRKKNAGKQ
jgi:predicted RNA-binding protein YlxR (DUF448 family)